MPHPRVVLHLDEVNHARKSGLTSGTALSQCLTGAVTKEQPATGNEEVIVSKSAGSCRSGLSGAGNTTE